MTRAPLPRTQSSLFQCARKGRREGDNRLPSLPFPWSLAAHHQSLAFRARLCHAKNEAPEEEAKSSIYFQGDNLKKPFYLFTSSQAVARTHVLLVHFFFLCRKQSENTGLTIHKISHKIINCCCCHLYLIIINQLKRNISCHYIPL